MEFLDSLSGEFPSITKLIYKYNLSNTILYSLVQTHEQWENAALTSI